MVLEFSVAAFPGAPVRKDALTYLVDCILHGWCCSVVGPSNTGKSFLLKSLPMEEVRQYCIRDGQPPPVMVFIDCLEAGDSEQAFYELILRRTIEELEHVDTSSPTMMETLRRLHHEVMHSATAVAFRSLYAQSVRTLSREAKSHVVLIFDEFYDVFQSLPPWPFRQLRALYDALGTRLCYITGTSHHLEQLRPGQEIYEFRELFHLHTLVLHPLSPSDARQFVAYLADRQRKTIAEQNLFHLIELSGGHPGLLERLYGLMSLGRADLTRPVQMTISDLLQQRPVWKECERLWSELEAEHEALLTLIEGDGRTLKAAQKRLLSAKGLITADTGEGVTLFSPVFKAFLQVRSKGQPQLAEKKGLTCDFESGQIWVNEEEITLILSEPQRKLVSFLYQKAGAVCSYDEIAEGVWGVGEGVSPGAIYELVKRVRQKVESDWKSPVYIITVPGKGYRLEVGGVPN